MGCPPSLGSYTECDKGMRDVKGLIRRSAVVEIWAVPSSLPFLAVFAALDSPHQQPQRATTPELPHHPGHYAPGPGTKFATPPQAASPDHQRNPKTKSSPSAADMALLLLPFPSGSARHLGRNAFSSRKYQFIKTLPKKRSLQTNFSFQKPSGEEKKKKKKRHATF